MWRERAKEEIRQANRTWFATLTVSPENHYRMQCEGLRRLEERSVDIKTLSQEEVFSAEHKALTRELTLFLKRVRKVSRAKLRYLLVVERHKSGYPHYHLLIHEHGVKVTYRQLAAEWKLGFTQFKLIADDRAAAYVAKYLSKSNDGRVRASIRYGETITVKTSSRHSPETMKGVYRPEPMRSEAKEGNSQGRNEEIGFCGNININNSGVKPLVYAQKVNDLCEQETT